jgi:hypothetical protein
MSILYHMWVQWMVPTSRRMSPRACFALEERQGQALLERARGSVISICNSASFYLDGKGSAHDMRVFSDATGELGLRPPLGKYFGNAGYTNGDLILTLLRGVKYHLREQWQSSRR